MRGLMAPVSPLPSRNGLVHFLSSEFSGGRAHLSCSGPSRGSHRAWQTVGAQQTLVDEGMALRREPDAPSVLLKASGANQVREQGHEGQSQGQTGTPTAAVTRPAVWPQASPVPPLSLDLLTCKMDPPHLGGAKRGDACLGPSPLSRPSTDGDSGH